MGHLSMALHWRVLVPELRSGQASAIPYHGPTSAAVRRLAA